MKKIVITNLVAEGVTIEGKINSHSSIRIDGTFKGDIVVESSQGIIVGPTGFIEGNIKSGGLVVLGKVKGKIDADSIEIRQSGLIEGEMKYQDLEVFSGGKFYGTTIDQKQEETKLT
jgi:cytoskeletal protein CcmA (bactofilin family)